MAYTIGTGNRGIIMKQQTSFGTVGSGTAFFGLIDDESFNTLFDVSARADMTRYGATTTKTGKRYSEGTINMALDDSGFTALLLKGIFPSVSTTGSGPYTHAMTEITHDNGRAAAESFPVYHILIQRDEKEHSYSSMSLNRVGLQANVGEYVMLSADFVGKAEGEDSITSPANLSNEGGSTVPDAGEPVHFQSAAVNFKNNGTASTNVRSVSLDIGLNRDVDASFSLGSDTCVREAPPQLREITGSIEFLAPLHSTSVDEPLYGDIIDGGTNSLFDPSGTNPAITLTFTASSTTSLVLKIYKVQWEAPTSTVSGRDTQSYSLNFTALFDETSNKKMADLTIINNTATI